MEQHNGIHTWSNTCPACIEADRKKAVTIPDGSVGTIGFYDLTITPATVHIEKIEGWHWCHICVTPFPNEGFLMSHKVMHINRAIAAR